MVSRGKEFWRSKTFWFNVLSLGVIVASAYGFEQGKVSAKLVEYGGAAVTLINIALRFVTKEPIVALRR